MCDLCGVSSKLDEKSHRFVIITYSTDTSSPNFGATTHYSWTYQPSGETVVSVCRECIGKRVAQISRNVAIGRLVAGVLIFLWFCVAAGFMLVGKTDSASICLYLVLPGCIITLIALFFFVQVAAVRQDTGLAETLKSAAMKVMVQKFAHLYAKDPDHQLIMTIEEWQKKLQGLRPIR